MQKNRSVGSDFSMYDVRMYDVRFMYDLVQGRFTQRDLRTYFVSIVSAIVVRWGQKGKAHPRDAQ